MASRERGKKPRLGASPTKNNTERDRRAQRRTAVREHALRDQVLKEQALQSKARRAKITEINALNSPLLRLPAELRSAIFAYVFSNNVYLFDGSNLYRKKPISMTSFDENDLGVLVTSRQLHAETALLPYRLSFFHFEFNVSKGEWSYCLEKFINNRTKQQELVLDKNMMVSQFGKYAGDHRYYHSTSIGDHSYHFSRERMEYQDDDLDWRIIKGGT